MQQALPAHRGRKVIRVRQVQSERPGRKDRRGMLAKPVRLAKPEPQVRPARKVRWGLQGPQGLTGPQGPQGPQGVPGSPITDYVDLTNSQNVGGRKRFTAPVRTDGLTRAGSETGSEAPTVGDFDFFGLVTRRVNSTSGAAGLVLARTDNMTLERDGSNAGLRVSYSANANGFLVCTATTSGSQMVVFRFQPPSTAGTTTVFLNSLGVELVQCSFGVALFPGHLTQITLLRHPNPANSTFVGTLTSTFNQ